MRDHHRHLALLRQLTMIVTIFTVLLGTSFTVMFAWTFIEPRFMFYAYDDLDWNSSMLGLVMNTYGIAMMLVEFSPSRMSDRLGRTPVILIGLVFFSAQFIGLAFSRNYILIATTFRHRVFSWSQWAQYSLLLWCFGSPGQSHRQPGRNKGS